MVTKVGKIRKGSIVRTCDFACRNSINSPIRMTGTVVRFMKYLPPGWMLIEDHKDGRRWVTFEDVICKIVRY